jgi:glycosyltransferase involved in cell wall biosynthesis
MVDLSVILPAYNEAHLIGDTLRRLIGYLDSNPSDAAWQTWEILVVDDGSDDGTAEVAQAASDAHVNVLRHARNRGKGGALKTGIEASRGAVLIATDVDLSYALTDLERAVRALDPSGTEELALVAGDRRHPESRMDLALSALGHIVRRQIISRAFNLAVRLFFALSCRDTQCGLKGFRREAARVIAGRLRTEGFLADVEMFIIAQRHGLKVGGIPVHLTYLSDDSTVDVVRLLPAVVRDALAIKRAQIGGAYD